MSDIFSKLHTKCWDYSNEQGGLSENNNTAQGLNLEPIRYGFESQLQALGLSDGGGEGDGKSGVPVRGTEISLCTKLLVFLPQDTGNNSNMSLFPYFFL